MADNHEFYISLDKRRAAYCTCVDEINIVFERWIKLLQLPTASMKEKSRGYRSVINRSRKNFQLIAQNLELEVVVLCIVATTKEKLAKVVPKNLVSDLKTRWANTSHPEALSLDARLISSKYPLSKLFSKPKLVPVSGAINRKEAADTAAMNLESAIHDAAKQLPFEAKQAWIPQCLESLRSFRQLTANAWKTDAKCTIARWDKLKDLLGGHLFEGMERSWFRRMEKQTESMISSEVTSAVNLRLADSQGGDFDLIIYLSADVGVALDKNHMGTWEQLLGRTLFDGMKESNEMRTRGCALFVENADGGDYKASIKLSFQVGRHIWRQCY